MSTIANVFLSLIAIFLFAVQSSSICFSADSVVLHWTLVNNTTLLDVRSKLEWTRSDNGHDIDWHRAGRFCNDLSGKWRLPTAEELLSLYDSMATVGVSCGSARCRVTGPFELTGGWFWSADSVGNDGSDGDELAWGVLLVNGARTKSVKELGDGSRALCVRSSTGSSSAIAKQPSLPNNSAAVAIPIDQDHAAVIFSWTHRGFSHPLARLEQLNGTLVWDRSDLAGSSVQVSLPLEGLRTGNQQLDKRLRGRDFFEAATYPMVTFKSTGITPHAGTGEFTLRGQLTLHGVTQPVTLEARINKVEDLPGQAPWTGFDANGVLRRSDFGLSRYIPLVADEITVHISLEAHAGE
jgi:polyisoprenoid-binding protein YceI